MIIVFITNRSINRIIIWSSLSFTGRAAGKGFVPMPGLYRISMRLMKKKLQGSWHAGSLDVIL